MCDIVSWVESKSKFFIHNQLIPGWSQQCENSIILFADINLFFNALYIIMSNVVMKG